MRFFKKLVLATALAVGIGMVLSLLAVVIAPGFLFEWRLDRAMVEAGAEFETVEVEGQTWEYAVGGDGEAIVLLHGFGADKRAWIPWVAQLSSRYRVVVPDLPGHGGSSAEPGQVYTLDGLSAAVADFVDSQDLPRFHLVGISLGGGVALEYALDHPERVSSLTLLNPWGVSTPSPSDHERQLERGHNVFFPETLEQLDELATFVYGTPLPLEDRYKRHLLEHAHTHRSFNERVFEHMHQSPPLDDRLAELAPRTLVIVGGADRIVHPSSLDTFRARAPGAQTLLLPGCAHVFLGPCFDRAYARLDTFLRP